MSDLDVRDSGGEVLRSENHVLEFEMDSRLPSEDSNEEFKPEVEIKEEPNDCHAGEEFSVEDVMNGDIMDSINYSEGNLSEEVKCEEDVECDHRKVEMLKDQPEEPPVYSRSGRLVKRIRDIGYPPKRPAKRNYIEPPPMPSGFRFCLICYSETDDDDVINSTPNIMERDFQVMFLLKKMLNIPKENLSDYLNHLGHPRDWITLCKSCAPTVTKAVVIQKEIARLEGNLRSFQQGIINAIKKTYKSKKMTPAVTRKDVLRVTNETRSFVVTGTLTIPDASTFRRQEKEPVLNIRKDGRGRRQRKKSTSSLARRKRMLKAHAAKRVETLLETLPISVPNTSSKENGIQEEMESHIIQVNLNVPILPVKTTTSIKEKVRRVRPRKRVHRQKMKVSKRFPTENDIDIIALKKSGYECALCPHIKEMSFNFFTHHVLFHYRRPYRCSDCNVYRSSTSGVELEPCPLNAVRKANQDKHVCSSSTLVKTIFKPGDIWPCEYCNKLFKCDLERDSHESRCSRNHIDFERHIIALKNPCTICDKKYRNVVEWRIHMVLEHPEVAAFGCYYCNEKFPVDTKEQIDLLDYEALRSHLKECHYYDKFETRMVHDCDFCGVAFWGIPVLSQHMETEHNIRKNKTMSCGVCHYRAENRSLLFQHARNIHYTKGKNVNMCDQCGYESFSDFKLDHHKFMKHGVEPKDREILMCPEESCDFKTIGNVSMNIHKMKVHNAARQYNCQTCGKGFLKRTQLDRHKQIHVNKNVKPFQCEICGNSFAVENYLYIHKRLSHQNRPFASTNKKKSVRKTNAKLTSSSTVPVSDGNVPNVGNNYNLPQECPPLSVDHQS